MTKPIKPSEVSEAKIGTFPNYVFEAFNELIAENFSNGRAVVKQKDVVQRILDKEPVDIPTIYKMGWLNVEDVYRAEGWKVEYDKPGYNENYDAFFVFKG